MIQGYGKYRLIRAGAILVERDYTNEITDEGKETFIAASFGGIRPGANWYFGLFQFVEGQGTPSGTMANHPAWIELNCGPTTRTPWPRDRIIENPISSSFTRNSTYGWRIYNLPITMTGPGQIDGVFITNKEAIGDDTGILWSKAQVYIPDVTDGDILVMDYAMRYVSETIAKAESAF